MYSLFTNPVSQPDARLMRIISEDVNAPELRDYKNNEDKKEAK